VDLSFVAAHLHFKPQLMDPQFSLESNAAAFRDIAARYARLCDDFLGASSSSSSLKG